MRRSQNELVNEFYKKLMDISTKEYSVEAIVGMISGKNTLYKYGRTDDDVLTLKDFIGDMQERFDKIRSLASFVQTGASLLCIGGVTVLGSGYIGQRIDRIEAMEEKIGVLLNALKQTKKSFIKMHKIIVEEEKNGK